MVAAAVLAPDGHQGSPNPHASSALHSKGKLQLLNSAQSGLTPCSQMNKKKQTSEIPVLATAMPKSRGGRPVRSAKQVQRAAGYVDSSTLLFDSEDEGTDDVKSESEHNSEDECKAKSDDGARHIAKKRRLGGKTTAQREATPPPPDSSCLAYYPALYEAVQRWNRYLNLPPPHPMSDTPGDKTRKRGVDTPEPQVVQALLAQDIKAEDTKGFTGSVPKGFRLVRDRSFINKNAFYDSKKAGFEKLPGEIRNKIYALAFKKKGLIDFMSRTGFAHSAAFLRVNRVVYNEARIFLYGKNRFVFGHCFSKSGAYYEPKWKELGWSHIRRFFTDIGPENTSLIQKICIGFSDASPSGNPDTDVDQRRYSYNEDVLWILNHLSEYGKILKLKLGFGGRRSIHMGYRDKDFLVALKGVKTDKLDIGNPKSNYRDIDHHKLDKSVESLIKVVMVRPVPLKEIDTRLEF